MLRQILNKDGDKYIQKLKFNPSSLEKFISIVLDYIFLNEFYLSLIVTYLMDHLDYK